MATTDNYYYIKGNILYVKQQLDNVQRRG